MTQTSTSTRQLIGTLCEQFGAGLSIYGFARHGTVEPLFVRPLPDGEQHVSLNIAKFKAEVQVALYFGVRFHAVEDLLNRHRNDISEAVKRRTASLGCELGNLHDGYRRVWHVASTGDIARVVVELLELFRIAGLPYLEKYSSIDVALSAMSKEDREADMMNPIVHARATTAVAIAFVRGDRVRFEEIFASKTKALRDARDAFGEREFLEAANRLRRELESPYR